VPDAPQPSVVALGGGHGLAVALRAIREYAGEITAVVSVADDGGSRAGCGATSACPRPATSASCLVALATDDGPWPGAFEHRFPFGELAGHALGNLVIVGLAESLGDLTGRARRSRPAARRGRPGVPGHRRSGHDEGRHRGRAVVGPGRGRVGPRRAPCAGGDRAGRRARATPDALEAIARADQIVLAPGLALHERARGAVRPEIQTPRSPRRAGSSTSRTSCADDETAGLDGTDHLRVLLDHGGGSTCCCTIPGPRAGRERDCGPGAGRGAGRGRHRGVRTASRSRSAKLAKALAALL
jgi:hypothetical protein